LEDFQKRLKDLWQSMRGEKGWEMQWQTIIRSVLGFTSVILGLIISVILFRRLRRLSWWNKFGFGWQAGKQKTVIEFYERMTKALENRGRKRAPSQTPLEFAFALDMPEAVKITEAYNKVRFGEKSLDKKESEEIENWLKDIENKDA
jgi:Domain of unknown function (DUF4129)